MPLDLEEQSRDFVQNLVSALREQRQFVSEDPSTESGESRKSTSVNNESGESDALQPRQNRIVGTIARDEIEGDDDAVVAVYPSRESGQSSLKENAAWGFVRGGRDFDYIAMYISGDVGEVRYFAAVDDVVDPHDADVERGVDRFDIEEGEKIIQFDRETFYELEEPIPYKSKYPQARRDTTLGKLRVAETTDDLF